MGKGGIHIPSHFHPYMNTPVTFSTFTALCNHHYHCHCFLHLSDAFHLLIWSWLPLMTTAKGTCGKIIHGSSACLCFLLFVLSVFLMLCTSEHFIILKRKLRPVIPALRGSEKTNKLIPLVWFDSCIPEPHLCLDPSTGPGVWGHWRQPTPLSRKALWTEDKSLLRLMIPFLKYHRQYPQPLGSLTCVTILTFFCFSPCLLFVYC